VAILLLFPANAGQESGQGRGDMEVVRTMIPTDWRLPLPG
jgi:hypothetical protein